MPDNDLENFYKTLAGKAGEVAHQPESGSAKKLHALLKELWLQYPAKAENNLEGYFSKHAESPTPGADVLEKNPELSKQLAKLFKVSYPQVKDAKNDFWTALMTKAFQVAAQGSTRDASKLHKLLIRHWPEYPARNEARLRDYLAQRAKSPTPGAEVLEHDSNLAERLATLLEIPAPFSFVKLCEEEEIERLRLHREPERFADEVLRALETDAVKGSGRTTGKELHELLEKQWDGYRDQKFNYEDVIGDPEKKSEIAKEMVEEIKECKFSPENLNSIRQKVGWKPDAYIGLAFSGGGIRSATFNLGVLQALAKFAMLRCVDYLSTVSGGGYIGSWLAAWVNRPIHSNNPACPKKGILEVEQALKDGADGGSSSEEPREVHFLRQYSNYLTPWVGILGADTWTMVAIYLRNVLLNLAIIISALSAFLILPRLTGLAFRGEGAFQGHGWVGWPIALLALALFLIASFAAWRNLSGLKDEPIPDSYDRFSCPKWVVIGVVIPTFLGAALLSLVLWQNLNAVEWLSIWDWMLLSAAAYLGVYGLGRLLGFKPGTEKSKDDPRSVRATFGWALIAGAVGGLLFLALVLILSHWHHHDAGGAWQAATLGPPLVCLVVMGIMVVHVGLLRDLLIEPRREWLSRVGAWLFIFLLAWAGVFAAAVYGPLVTVWLLAHSKTAIASLITWLAGTGGGLLAGRSDSTGKPGSKSGLEVLAKAGPYVFALGLVLLLSFGVNETLARLPLTKISCLPPIAFTSNPTPDIAVSLNVHEGSAEADFAARSQPEDWFTQDRGRHWQMLNGTSTTGNPPTVLFALGLLAWLAALCGVALGLSRRVDINLFSMNLFYRNRLIRCYLGASHEPRNPQPFTGFDTQDDVLLSDLRFDKNYHGPYPIINTTLDVTRGDELAWQERKGLSFVMSPLFCGFNKTSRAGETITPCVSAENNLDPNAYRSSDEYPYAGGIYLGGAVSISGAAASPNMGFHTDPALAFLMTIFDVRLGWWLANPRRRDKRDEEVPKSGLLYLLNELFAQTNDTSAYVYVSDGGHFENLGIYELVRRRCRYIIVGDGSADPKLTFEDLGNAIRKCRADFGAEIKIDVERIRRDAATNRSRAHCAVGTIAYPELDEKGEPIMGSLVYLKPSIVGDEPADVLEYVAAHPDFPHQSTADQWFDESQFESYRKLGFHVATTAFEAARRYEPNFCREKENFFKILSDVWYPPSPAVGKHFVNLADAYDEMIERIRKDRNLLSLDKDFLGFDASTHPGKDKWKDLAEIVTKLKPETYEQHRSVFYFCCSLIQLMENVYVDLDLETNHEHPDNEGWMAIFRHWVKSPKFREAWEKSSAYYGTRFTRFCEGVLKLPHVERGHLADRPQT